MKNNLKIDTRNQVKIIIWYELCLILFSSLYLRYKIVNMTETDDLDTVTSLAATSGIPYLLGLGVFLFILYRRNTFSFTTIFKVNKKINLKSFLSLLILSLLAQILTSYIVVYLEQLANIFDYTFFTQLENNSAIQLTFSLFIYTTFFGPFVEEIIFRGILLRNLEKYGKVFAIIITSLLFGVLHGDIFQGLSAVMAGIILAYISIEYSIVWAIVLHIINNLIFGYALDFVLSNYSLSFQNSFFFRMLLILLISSFFIIFKSYGYTKNYINTNRSDRKLYESAFSSFLVKLYIIIHIFLALSNIGKI